MSDFEFDFDDSVDVFPKNVIDIIYTRFTQLWPSTEIQRRRLRQNDPTQTIGIFPMTWGLTDDEASFEIGSVEPTLQTYVIGIQALVISTSATDGIKTHQVMSKLIRSTLYNDSILKLGLNPLAVTMNGIREVIQQRGVSRVRYIDNQLAGNYIYLSTTEFWVNTESK